MSAPPDVTNATLAEELSLGESTVRKHRRAAQRERQEVAREVLARHVEENIPDALRDLTDLRRMARERYEAEGDARTGNLWLGAIKTTLEHVKPDDRDLDAAIEFGMAQVAAVGQGTPARAHPATPPVH